MFIFRWDLSLPWTWSGGWTSDCPSASATCRTPGWLSAWAPSCTPPSVCLVAGTHSWKVTASFSSRCSPAGSPASAEGTLSISATHTKYHGRGIAWWSAHHCHPVTPPHIFQLRLWPLACLSSAWQRHCCRWCQGCSRLSTSTAHKIRGSSIYHWDSPWGLAI